MLQKIVRALVEGRLIGTTTKAIGLFCKKVIKKIDMLISLPSIRMLSKITPIDENKIVFLTFRGEYDCNAKWISLELLKRKLPYELVWMINAKTSEDLFPEEMILTTRGTYDLFKHMASAKIIIDNGVSTAWMGYRKKKDQILIETWHGSLGIKKFSKDTVKNKHWVNIAFIEGAMTDYCISNSKFEEDVLKEDYWKDNRFLKLGHARNDILFEQDTDRLREIRQKVYNKYALDQDVKICLYAPTFRDDNDMRPYKINYEKLQEALRTRFGGKWVIFTRFHFKMLKKLKNFQFPQDVINVGQYPDIQELLACTDVGITDYSSWICDFLLTKRPGFLFATDMEHYTTEERGFYYPLETLPFPLATNNNQLAENILKFNETQFIQDCDAFLKDKGCIDDGHASERIADAIEILMKGESL